MAPVWLSCCVVRGSDNFHAGLPPVRREDSEGSEYSDDDELFFDCVETTVQLTALQANSFKAALAESRDPPKDVGGAGHSGCCSDLPDLAVARAVLERAQEEWGKRVSGLATGGPELEWADLAVAKRMLAATKTTHIDVQKAVEMFVQALEFRARYRELFQTLNCQTCADLRIIARDVEAHPAIYMCARSLNAPLRTIRDQFMVTFEAACRQTPADGRVIFVVDMHGMRPHLYMDFSAIKDLSDTLGTVFAERILRIIIVDFSRAAQAAWWMLKPLLTQKTRDKFAFVTHAQAKDLCREIFSAADYGNLCSTFDINRDPDSSDSERELHARRTTLCNVPLGPPLK